MEIVIETKLSKFYFDKVLETLEELVTSNRVDHRYIEGQNAVYFVQELKDAKCSQDTLEVR